mgnify:CR=1 FL=1
MEETSIAAYEVVAKAFAVEGTEAHFTLLGDGNMHWATALARQQGVRTYHVRHEHCAVGLAIGYASATGKVGVASVTHGPRLTHSVTALTVAVEARIPLVLFAAETPMRQGYHTQFVDQPPLAAAVGARYIAVHSHARLLASVREAFYYARLERRPVVLAIPSDLLLDPFSLATDYAPISLPDPGDLLPGRETVEKLAERHRRCAQHRADWGSRSDGRQRGSRDRTAWRADRRNLCHDTPCTRHVRRQSLLSFYRRRLRA